MRRKQIQKKFQKLQKEIKDLKEKITKIDMNFYNEYMNLYQIIDARIENSQLGVYYRDHDNRIYPQEYMI